jgi:peptide chain release factor
MQFPVPLPQEFLNKAWQLGVRPEDITMQFIRGSGAGGQKINKTNNCVQLRHWPTETEVRCQEHREQSLNRLAAYKLLILKEKKLGKQSEIAQEIFKLRKQKKRRSKKAKEKMLQAKKKRGEVKKNRKKVR